MARHDWGPCDCSECRERIFTHDCPICQFPNKVSVDRDARWVVDRKGVGDYEFEIPTEPVKDLDCYSCGYTMERVGYYTTIAEDACRREKERADLIRAGKVCGSCNKVEGLD